MMKGKLSKSEIAQIRQHNIAVTESIRLKKMIDSGAIKHDHVFYIFMTEDDYYFAARGDLIPLVGLMGHGAGRFLEDI